MSSQVLSFSINSMLAVQWGKKITIISLRLQQTRYSIKFLHGIICLI